MSIESGSRLCKRPLLSVTPRPTTRHESFASACSSTTRTPLAGQPRAVSRTCVVIGLNIPPKGTSSEGSRPLNSNIERPTNRRLAHTLTIEDHLPAEHSLVHAAAQAHAGIGRDGMTMMQSGGIDGGLGVRIPENEVGIA